MLKLRFVMFYKKVTKLYLYSKLN